MKRRKKTLWAVAVVAALYLLYVGGSALLLNTPLLMALAKMSDPSLTHLRMGWAWSLYPGHLRAGRLVVAIRDQHVKVDVDVRHVRARFSPRALLRKEIRFRDVTATDGALLIEMKGPHGTAEHHAKHSKPGDQFLPTPERMRQMRESTWTIHVENVRAVLKKVRVGGEDYVGNATVEGGFRLVPGVEAEIFPSRVSVKNGSVSDKLSKLDFDAQGTFHKFIIPHTGGNEVFRYLDADVSLSAVAEDLEILNLTLRSLDGYGFGKSHGNVKAEISVRRGDLQQGSYLRVAPSPLEFTAPSFSLQGRGSVRWEVPSHGRHSTLNVHLTRPKAQVSFGKKSRVTGTVGRVDAGAILFGVNLESAFHGLKGTMAIEWAKLSAHDRGDDALKWSVDLAARGKISAVAGKVPPSQDNGVPQRLIVDVRSSRFQSKKPTLDLRPRGRITLKIPPVDMRQGKVNLKELLGNFDLGLASGREVEVSMATEDISHHFSTQMGGTGRWRGVTRLGIQGFDDLMAELGNPLDLPGIVTTIVSTDKLNAELEWEHADEGWWIRARSVESSGIWSLWGTLQALKDEKPMGVFEARVLGVPVGVKIRDGEAPVQVFPSAEWYNE